jgi:alcohol dehydrogenase, propanol-preferring
VVVDFAGMNTTRTAIAALRPGGRAVQVGVGNPEATISVMHVVLHTATLDGTKICILSIIAS